MTPRVIVRKASSHDLPYIHQLVQELAIYEKAEHEFIATLEDYKAHFMENAFHALVATTEAQEVIGMALYYPSYSTWKGKMMYLEDFVVKQAYRRKGVGSMLFEAFLADAKQKECKLVKWQVLDWNEPAMQFYHKKKAIIEKEWWNGKIFFEEKS
jgi:N-acetylglutamate synthase-like GNAT family acetyltransferase